MSYAGDFPNGIRFGQHGLPPVEKPGAAKFLLLPVGHEVETSYPGWLGACFFLISLVSSYYLRGLCHSAFLH